MKGRRQEGRRAGGMKGRRREAGGKKGRKGRKGRRQEAEGRRHEGQATGVCSTVRREAVAALSPKQT